MFLTWIIALLLLSGPPVPQDAAVRPAQTVDAAAVAPADTDIADCLICHGKRKLTELSSSARRALLMKHPGDEKVPLKSDDPEFLKKLYVDPDAFLNSAHGKIKCMECHVDVTLPSHRPNRAPAICVSCHKQQHDDFRASRHFLAAKEGIENLPDCMGCHGPPHTMALISQGASPVNASRITATCGACHEPQERTYARTFHGLYRALGNMDTAQCVTCHGNHRVLSPTDPASPTYPDRLGSLCAQCHEEIAKNMAGFQAHLEPLKDRDNPIVFGTAWFMRILILGVMGFFLVHSLLYLVRSLPDLFRRFKPGSTNRDAGAAYYIRFPGKHRVAHYLVILSFFGLCLTGFPLSLAQEGWAQRAMMHVGGPQNAALIHRICAGVVGLYMVLHLVFLWRNWIRPPRGSGRPVWFGPDSLLPTRRDFRELKDHMLWFVGLGKRPAFGRWTYMEKFDYLAVFWGVALIGKSGLILWFHEQVVHFLPPWILNWAQVVHSDEAMLAVAYVFAIHFFHTHLRPATLPMDPVMFTGREPLSKIENDRPDLAARLTAADSHPPLRKSAGPSVFATLCAYLFGLLCLALGIALLCVLTPHFLNQLFP